MQMPQDPMLLLSVVNTYLRDEYDSLDALCSDRQWNMDELTAKLSSAGFSYAEALNQFR